jgi:uncharacterized SAM-binding protein YcdF (DUF218 family)
MNSESRPTQISVQRESTSNYDAVIALGKNWRLPITGEPRIDLSLESKMTALAAAKLYKDGKVEKIIFSTGKTAGKDKFGNDYPPEADEMYKYMRRFYSEEEIPSEAVILQNSSFDTAGDAEESGKILKRHGINRPALLTIGTHLPRAKRLFSNYGIKIAGSFSSQEVLKGRNPHLDKFLHDYSWRLGIKNTNLDPRFILRMDRNRQGKPRSIRHVKEIVKEAIGTVLVYTIDPKGDKIVRKMSAKTRNRE